MENELNGTMVCITDDVFKYDSMHFLQYMFTTLLCGEKEVTKLMIHPRKILNEVH